MAYRQSKLATETKFSASPVTSRSMPSKLARTQSQSCASLRNMAEPSSSGTSGGKTLTRQTSSTQNLLVQLTSDQKQVLSAVKKGSSLFFTGSGGTGKSFLIHVIRKCLPSESCFVTASTGVAASLINGITLHAFSGINADLVDQLYYKEGVADPDADENRAEFVNTRLKEILGKISASKEKMSNWKKCQHLIVDEISMIDTVLFETLDFVARYGRVCFFFVSVFEKGSFFIWNSLHFLRLA